MHDLWDIKMQYGINIQRLERPGSGESPNQGKKLAAKSEGVQLKQGINNDS